MIDQIVRLKHPGVMREFSWPSHLPNFDRFNLIYGWNGCGKTTLSRFFRSLEQQQRPAVGEVTFRINGESLAGPEFPRAPIQVRVFNRDFVDENVFPVGGGDVPPIFVVGKESVEKQKKADELRTRKANAEGRVRDLRGAKKRAEDDFDRHCIENARVIKEALRTAGEGAYNQYDKRSYRTKADEILAANDSLKYRLNEGEREKLLIQHRATTKSKLKEVQYEIPPLKKLYDEVAVALRTTVVSSALPGLKNDRRLSDWSRDGLKLHQERGAEICLFCEQPLPQKRLDALTAHFSAEYERFIERLAGLISRLETIRTQAKEVRLPDGSALYGDLEPDYLSGVRSLDAALEQTADVADGLLAALEDKKGKPFSAMDLDLEISEIDLKALSDVNEVIRRHNLTSDEFSDRTALARDRLAGDMIAQQQDAYSQLRQAASDATDAVAPAEQEVERLDEEIRLLERDIVEHRQPGDELSRDLARYLGHDELRLEPRKTGYALMRRDVPAKALSEGERTALALLYFLKSLSDRRFELSAGVVVLDDPVSSLDANALYLAFGFIRERTKDAYQLFIFTHNFTFFRQVRNWFHCLRGPDKKRQRFYMLDRVRQSDVRCTELRTLDALLEKYESEYHFLFSCVFDGAKTDAELGLEKNYPLPNIARRLLEMFLAFRRPDVAGELWQKLKGVEYDEAKKLRIIRFLHTHSHGDGIGEPEHDPSLLGEGQAVLADLLELIRSEDSGHYDAMLKVMAQTEAQ